MPPVIRSSGKHAVIENVVDLWLGKKPKPAIHNMVPVSDVKPFATHTSPSTPQPPLASYRELQYEAPKADAAAAPQKPVPFVCEDDVRAAIKGHSQIRIGKKTIITPSARDLAENNHVFVISD
jgi:hypothetical protein